MAQQLTEQEKLFFSRAAIHAANGMSFEDACAAVIADDRRIAATFDSLRSYDRDYAKHRIAKQVFAGIHARDAGLRVVSA
jgi:predicted nucleic acid-binding protein